MMYDFKQLRRDAAQLELDLHDLARNVDRMLPDRSDISRGLRIAADQMDKTLKEIISEEEVA